MILGNKCDLSDSRVVSKERGQMLADEHSIKFMETSAKASINVEEVQCYLCALVCSACMQRAYVCVCVCVVYSAKVICSYLFKI